MWFIKAMIQLVLSVIPMGEKINHFLQKANKGHTSEELKERIISFASQLHEIDEVIGLKDKAFLEIGTGWHPIVPIILYLYDIRKCYTYDHVPHVRFEILVKIVHEIDSLLPQIVKVTNLNEKELKKKISVLLEKKSTSELFQHANIVYNAPSDAARTGLADDSVDIIYSNAVFEHLPVAVIDKLMIEAKRILKKESGVYFHSIDLRDHFAYFDSKISYFNFLKFSTLCWRFIGCNKINYQNRLREQEYVDVFKKHGSFIKDIKSHKREEDLAVLQSLKINKAYKKYSLEQLSVVGTRIIGSFL